MINYSITPLFRFDILTCPEPQCDYVSENRDQIEGHMTNDHMLEKTDILKLFFCQICSRNLELRDRKEFEMHASTCEQNQVHLSVRMEEDEETQESASQPEAEQREYGAPASVVEDTSRNLDSIDIIKCDRCEYKLECKYPSSEYSKSLRQSLGYNPSSGYSKSLRYNMEDHYREAHNVENMKFCKRQDCDFRTQSPIQMRNHLRIKSCVGKIQCEICGKCISAGGIKAHMKTHSEQTFDCEHCLRPYAKKEMIK